MRRVFRSGGCFRLIAVFLRGGLPNILNLLHAIFEDGHSLFADARNGTQKPKKPSFTLGFLGVPCWRGCWSSRGLKIEFDEDLALASRISLAGRAENGAVHRC